MLPRDVVTALISALLGGGGIAFVTALVRGWRSVRAGARALEREAVADLARYRDELDERARRAERDRDYWRTVAGTYAWQLARAGIDPMPANPVPPSERATS